MNQLRQLLSFVLLICLTQYANGQGLTCATAEAVMPGTYTTAGPATNGGTATGYLDELGYGITATNADWYSFTPPANGLLSINSCLGGTDTRLILHDSCNDTADDIDATFAHNDDFCAMTEGGNNYASDLSNIIVEGGVTYYIEWDNVWSGDGFTWTLDFVESSVTNDAAIVGYAVSPFYQVPFTQLQDSIDLAVMVDDLLTDVSNASLTVVVTNSAGDTVYMNTTEMMPIGGPMTITAGTWLPTAEDSYTATYTLNVMEEEADVENNTASHALDFQVTYAAEFGANGSLGYGTMGTIWMGEAYPINADDVLTSVTGFINGGSAGMTYAFEVYEVVDGVVGAMLGDSGDQTLDAPAPGWVTHSLTAPIAVTAGQTIMVAIRSEEPDDASNTGLGTASYNFVPGTSFVATSGGPTNGEWVLVENLFEVAFAIRANFGVGSYNLTLHVDMNNEETISPDGVHVAGDFNGWDPAATPMSDDDMDGVYTVTVSVDGNSDVQYRFINGNTMAGTETVPASCGVDDGTGVLNRSIAVGLEAAEADLVCFSTCAFCVPDACEGEGVIFCDSFEEYDASMPLSGQSPWWSTWSGTVGTAEEGIVDTTVAYDGTNSMLIAGTDPNGGPQDAVLLLGDRDAGRYCLSFWINVPAGNSAYYNVQHVFDAAAQQYQWASQIFFDGAGTATLDAGTSGAATFSFENGSWVQITQIIDIDNDWSGLLVNDEPIFEWPFSWQATSQVGGTNELAALDFYPLDDSYTFYIDDIVFKELPPVAAGDDCFASTDLSDLMGGGPDVPVLSSVAYDNTNATVSGFEPADFYGWECFGEPDAAASLPSLENTLWFTFTGDGNAYFIETLNCDAATNYIIDGDTQMAIYQGECNELVAVDCNEDSELAVTGDYVSGLTIPTEDGVTYYMMIDGFDATEFGGGPSIGDFCIQMTQQPVAMTNVVFAVNMTEQIECGNMNEGDPAYLVGSWDNLDEFVEMESVGDGVYTVTLSLEANADYNYLFSTTSSFGGVETAVPAACSVNDNGVNFRQVSVATENVILPTVCFNRCEEECPAVGVADLNFAQGLKLFPNPASNVANLEFNFADAIDLDVRITNSLGQLVDSYQVARAHQGTLTLDVSAFSAGVYHVDITNGSLNVTKRLTVK